MAKARPVWYGLAGQREPNAELAEASRSPGQPEACCGAEPPESRLAEACHLVFDRGAHRALSVVLLGDVAKPVATSIDEVGRGLQAAHLGEGGAPARRRRVALRVAKTPRLLGRSAGCRRAAHIFGVRVGRLKLVHVPVGHVPESASPGAS